MQLFVMYGMKLIKEVKILDKKINMTLENDFWEWIKRLFGGK